MTLALDLSGIGKSFPGVRALDEVAFPLAPGEIHALVGENGAGKSTLIKIITGVHPADEGGMRLFGEAVRFASPREAMAQGIGAVHQERNLIPRFSVGENIMLERLPRRLGLVDYARIHAEARSWLELLELPIDPRTPVRELSVAQMQLVEIAKALTLRSRILLLDEPTASITPHETAVLFGLLRRLRDEGVAIVFVSHKLEELYEIADRVTVLRDGRNACVAEPMRSLARADLVRLMIGRDEQVTAVEAAARPGAPALELRQVATSVGHADLSFTLHEGEILGLYGLVGAGRSELAKALVGVDRVTAGEIRVNGRPAAIASPTDALHRNGIGYVSEDRKSEGLILMHSVQRNICTTVWGRIAGLLGTLTGRAERGRALPLIRALDIRTPSPAQTVGNLSGGNQQKVSIAKWLAAEARILIVDEPTVGIDIRTKANLHGLIRAMAREGKAVLLITSDMPEMIELADRICVMAGFRIVGELANSRDYDGMSARIMALIQASEDVEGPPAPASAFAPAQ